MQYQGVHVGEQPAAGRWSGYQIDATAATLRWRTRTSVKHHYSLVRERHAKPRFVYNRRAQGWVLRICAYARASRRVDARYPLQPSAGMHVEKRIRLAPTAPRIPPLTHFRIERLHLLAVHSYALEAVRSLSSRQGPVRPSGRPYTHVHPGATTSPLLADCDAAFDLARSYA